MSEITKERAEELDAAWRAADSVERLRLHRMEWFNAGDGTTYFEVLPSKLELVAHAEILRLRALVASTQEKCAQVAETAVFDNPGDYDVPGACRAIASAIRSLNLTEPPHE